MSINSSMLYNKSTLISVLLSFISVVFSLSIYGAVLFFSNSLLILYLSTLFILLANYGLRLYWTKSSAFNFQLLFIFTYFYYITGEVQSVYKYIGDALSGSYLEAFVLINAGAIVIVSILTFFKIKKENNRTSLSNTEINFKGNSKYVTFIIRIFIIFYIMNSFASSLSLALYGRHSEVESLVDFGIISTFITAFAVISPSILLLRINKKMSVWRVLDFVLIFFIFVSLALTGTRFYILFALVIFSHRVINIKKINTLSLSALFFIAILIGNLVREVRGSFENFNIENLFYFHSEGLVYYFSGLVRYYENFSHNYYPLYSVFWSYALIPRSIFSAKPELIGKWILHTNSFQEQFSEKHSGSVSFVGPFFADFGYTMFLPIFFVGLLLAFGEKNYLKYAQEPSFRGIIYAAFPALIFFSFRSFNTSIIFFVVISIVILGLSFLQKIRLK